MENQPNFTDQYYKFFSSLPIKFVQLCGHHYFNNSLQSSKCKTMQMSSILQVYTRLPVTIAPNPLRIISIMFIEHSYKGDMKFLKVNNKALYLTSYSGYKADIPQPMMVPIELPLPSRIHR